MDATSLDVEVRDLTIPAEWHGERFDRALAALIPEFSRSYLQQLMADGAVLLRGAAPRKPSVKVQVGDPLRVELRPTQQAMAFVPEAMALDVVYEDEHLLVVNKPAGLVVHPAAGHWSGTLLNGLLAHHAGAASLPRAGIVHRLDKDTSGLMLVGKSRQSVEALVRAIAARDVKREYLALALGRWQGADTCLVDQPIGRDNRNRLRMAVIREEVGSGKPAQTTVTLLEQGEQVCLVHCKLHTGRTHQIRVHMGWLSHPLLGDTLYGGKSLLGMERQALHAARLSLAHPVSGKALAFESTPPADWMAALDQAGLHYNRGSSV
ncbi:RluA family pseudouridine synthase [Hydrogenophaga sp. PAMC20947]|uniref:RluA family pseudouridine synthase n=1 Tax=Hydrogenophaga sp. PAMC20947 TaxID=2565558 RepID=UPI00109E000F|nr:RluA family pseudouridine synthase [Hydrogenophaga sp. PAMC20947]QCB48571.1 RluA family pseudouridine synthase [Hydrogenophaga sp. PAMC20947]